MKPSGIGGQALMEGVMMKNGNLYACAVRKPDNEIIVDVQETKPIADRCPIFKWPILRGMVTFVDSMYIGVKTLTWSASFFEDEEETKDGKKTSAPKEKTAKDKKKESLFMAGTVAISIILAVGIFMILPYFLSLLLKKFIDSPTILALCEGLIRIGLFVGYVAAISCMKDIRRVFMYHGAEHKSINCVEHGYELTVSNVKKCSREHKRCGTSFLLIVMVISVVFFVFIRVESTWLMVLIRLLLIPIIAGISYEFIRLAGRSESKFVAFLSKPGLALQNFTTREPDDSMIECAIASVEAVFDWRKYQAEAKQELEDAKRAKESSLDRKRRERAEESKKRLKARGMDDTLSEEQERAIDAAADKATEGQEIDVDAEIAAFVARKREEARRAAEAAFAEQNAPAGEEQKASVDKAASEEKAAPVKEEDTKNEAPADKSSDKEAEQLRTEERTRNLKSEIEADVARENRNLSKKAAKKEAMKQANQQKMKAKQAAANQNAAKQDSQKQEATKQATSNQNTAKQEATKQAATNQNAAKQEATKQAAANQNAAKQEASKQAAANQNNEEKNNQKQEPVKQNNDKGFNSGRYVPNNRPTPSKPEVEDDGDFKGNETMNGYFRRPEKKNEEKHSEMGGYFTSTNRSNVYVETMSPVENDTDEQDDVLNALDRFFVGKKKENTEPKKENTESKKEQEQQPETKQTSPAQSENGAKNSSNSNSSKKKGKKKK